MQLERFGRAHQTIHGDGGRVIARVLRTCESMLRARGVVDVEATSPDAVGDAIAHGDGHVMTGRRGEGGGELRVYVHNEDRVGVKYMRAILDACDGRDVDLIVVSLEGPTPVARKECLAHRVQFMLARDLTVDLVTHALVPAHERVDATELPPGVAPEALPCLLETDRVAQYYDWPVGTIVRITRCFGGHETTHYFRRVVAATRS